MRSIRIGLLLIAIAAAAAVGESTPAHAEDEAEMLAVDPRTLKFTPIPDMPSCVSAAALRCNPRSGPASVLLKLASGCRVPWHWHTATEDLVIISGQGTIMMKDSPPLRFAPGAFTSLPGHHTHQASCSRACLLFVSADGAFDIHYVDANGKEISAEKALGKSASKKK